MNVDIWERIGDNFKIEIIYFAVNTSHKFAIHNSNVEIQKVVLFVTAYTAFQYQCVIIDIFFGDRAKVLQIRYTYIIQMPTIIW